MPDRYNLTLYPLMLIFSFHNVVVIVYSPELCILCCCIYLWLNIMQIVNKISTYHRRCGKDQRALWLHNRFNEVLSMARPPFLMEPIIIGELG